MWGCHNVTLLMQQNSELALPMMIPYLLFIINCTCKIQIFWLYNTFCSSIRTWESSLKSTRTYWLLLVWAIHLSPKYVKLAASTSCILSWLVREVVAVPSHSFHQVCTFKSTGWNHEFLNRVNINFMWTFGLDKSGTSKICDHNRLDQGKLNLLKTCVAR